MDRNLGELGRTILIHGLYRRTWEVASYHMNTLSSWVPSAQAPNLGSSQSGTVDPRTDYLESRVSQNGETVLVIVSMFFIGRQTAR